MVLHQDSMPLHALHAARMQALDAIKGHKAESLGFSSAFASATARIHTDKASHGKPGCATYCTFCYRVGGRHTQCNSVWGSCHAHA